MLQFITVTICFTNITYKIIKKEIQQLSFFYIAESSFSLRTNELSILKNQSQFNWLGGISKIVSVQRYRNLSDALILFEITLNLKLNGWSVVGAHILAT